MRMVGGFNSAAGLFLATAIMHFLLSVFRVSPVAALPLGAAWLLLGTGITEAFFCKF